MLSHWHFKNYPLQKVSLLGNDPFPDACLTGKSLVPDKWVFVNNPVPD